MSIKGEGQVTLINFQNLHIKSILFLLKHYCICRLLAVHQQILAYLQKEESLQVISHLVTTEHLTSADILKKVVCP